MEALLYAPFILFALGVMVYLALQVKRDRERSRRADQYSQWVTNLSKQGPEAVKANLPHIMRVMGDPRTEYRGPWEDAQL